MGYVYHYKGDTNLHSNNETKKNNEGKRCRETVNDNNNKKTKFVARRTDQVYLGDHFQKEFSGSNYELPHLLTPEDVDFELERFIHESPKVQYHRTPQKKTVSSPEYHEDIQVKDIGEFMDSIKKKSSVHQNSSEEGFFFENRIQDSFTSEQYNANEFSDIYFPEPAGFDNENYIKLKLKISPPGYTKPLEKTVFAKRTSSFNDLEKQLREDKECFGHFFNDVTPIRPKKILFTFDGSKIDRNTLVGDSLLSLEDDDQIDVSLHAVEYHEIETNHPVADTVELADGSIMIL